MCHVHAMFLGVINRPILHTWFDGKVLLERVSKEVEVTKLTAHHYFSNDVLIITKIKNSEWIQLFYGLRFLA